VGERQHAGLADDGGVQHVGHVVGLALEGVVPVAVHEHVQEVAVHEGVAPEDLELPDVDELVREHAQRLTEERRGRPAADVLQGDRRVAHQRVVEVVPQDDELVEGDRHRVDAVIGAQVEVRGGGAPGDDPHVGDVLGGVARHAGHVRGVAQVDEQRLHPGGQRRGAGAQRVDVEERRREQAGHAVVDHREQAPQELVERRARVHRAAGEVRPVTVLENAERDALGVVLTRRQAAVGQAGEHRQAALLGGRRRRRHPQGLDELPADVHGGGGLGGAHGGERGGGRGGGEQTGDLHGGLLCRTGKGPGDVAVPGVDGRQVAGHVRPLRGAGRVLFRAGVLFLGRGAAARARTCET
jgi:hypothetical protein